MKKAYRIISIEAADIYRKEQENGVSVGYKMPENKSDAYFRLFKIYLDNSLDSVELENAYKRICRKKFYFKDKSENEYTLAVINLKFNYTYKSENGKPIKIKDLRSHFYENGFYLDGVHYVRYKRSAGSSREGKCLFIDERLYKAMDKWSSCGLKAQTDLASWESYKALSLSSIKGTVDIPLEGILFVPDYKSTFTEEVISVELKDGKLVAEQKQTEITNDIWDGESLLDESVFESGYADKHMLLLRNKFFKSCAFRTKLQKWIKDKNITLDDIKKRGFTLATDVNQIVMVTTPNSLKYLKFAGGLSEKNIRKWIENIDNTFGVVKWDKGTRFFHGDMVQSSYQLLNTLGLDKAQAEKLLQPSFDYISLVRNDVEFMRYHFTDAYVREKEEKEKKVPDGLAERAEVIFRLLFSCSFFDCTALYANFRDDVVSGLKSNLRRGHILLNGTNATLFGNGPELLKYIAGEKITSELKKGEIYSKRFANGVKLLCARSPHITMGNLYCVENNLNGDIWNYFDLGENIVCVNAIGENIQQRLNGCDYDSDAMLITDDKLLVEAVEKHKENFKVPVCGIPSMSKIGQTLAELDHDTSENKIGEIVNLSQKLNSIIWNEIHHGAPIDKILDIYNDVCKLAVLSGLEIDKAKRAYDNVNVGKELSVLRKKYNRPAPIFFKEIDEKGKDNEYEFYDTAMDYIYQAVRKFNFLKGKRKRINYMPISWVVGENATSDNATDYRHRDKIIEICEEYRTRIDRLYMELRIADDQEKEVLYDRITEEKAERDRQVSKWLTSKNVLIFVVRHYEKNRPSDWRIYAPIVNSNRFKDFMLKGGSPIGFVEENKNGNITVYGKKFARKW
ncbi:MAG: hypothetical protein E7340_05995 [Clostridiales bacterium]|nr:hypothetical protein [Clostridiales bacterium]